jgi:hypothetical protein
MNSQPINAFKSLAVQNDDVKFLVSILTPDTGVAPSIIPDFTLSKSLQEKQWK